MSLLFVFCVIVPPLLIPCLLNLARLVSNLWYSCLSLLNSWGYKCTLMPASKIITYNFIWPGGMFTVPIKKSMRPELVWGSLRNGTHWVVSSGTNLGWQPPRQAQSWALLVFRCSLYVALKKDKELILRLHWFIGHLSLSVMVFILIRADLRLDHLKL